MIKSESSLYSSLGKPLLFRFDPEKVHEKVLKLCSLVGSNSLLEKSLSKIYREETPELATQIGSLSFPNIVGLAAGLDKNGVAVPCWQALGFGHAEVGTVTPLAQPGNPSPRLFRLPQDRALINRMGFNNVGADQLVKNLGEGKGKIPIGINVGKNKITPIEKAVGDYVLALEKTWEAGDYFTINISSPNTQDLRSLQKEETLPELLKAVLKKREEMIQKHGKKKPIWVKIAPDLQEEEIEVICGLMMDFQMDALILGNTTIGREGIVDPKKKETGGLSGSPLREKSNALLRSCFQYTQGKIPLIGVGGIFSAKDALEKILLGASLVQIYTGFIYEGPSLVKRINRGTARILQAEGISHISDVVGVGLSTFSSIF